MQKSHVGRPGVIVDGESWAIIVTDEQMPYGMQRHRTLEVMDMIEQSSPSNDAAHTHESSLRVHR